MHKIYRWTFNNVNGAAGDSGDSSMLDVFDEIVGPAAQRFKPDIILVRSQRHYKHLNCIRQLIA